MEPLRFVSQIQLGHFFSMGLSCFLIQKEIPKHSDKKNESVEDQETIKAREINQEGQCDHTLFENAQTLTSNTLIDGDCMSTTSSELDKLVLASPSSISRSLVVEMIRISCNDRKHKPKSLVILATVLLALSQDKCEQLGTRKLHWPRIRENSWLYEGKEEDKIAINHRCWNSAVISTSKHEAKTNRLGLNKIHLPSANDAWLICRTSHGILDVKVAALETSSFQMKEQLFQALQAISTLQDDKNRKNGVPVA